MSQASKRLRHGDIVAVSGTTTSGPVVRRIDKVHWDTDPVWLSMIDGDTGEWRSAQLQHVVGRLKNYDPAPRATLEPSPAPPPYEVAPGLEVVFQDSPDPTSIRIVRRMPSSWQWMLIAAEPKQHSA